MMKWFKLVLGVYGLGAALALVVHNLASVEAGWDSLVVTGAAGGWGAVGAYWLTQWEKEE